MHGWQKGDEEKKNECDEKCVRERSRRMTTLEALNEEHKREKMTTQKNICMKSDTKRNTIHI